MKTPVVMPENLSQTSRAFPLASAVGDERSPSVPLSDPRGNFRKEADLSPARTGVTLIEITVVLLLLGIVAAVAQPRFSSALSAYRLDAAAERVRADLEYARTLARVRSRTTTVRFEDVNAGGFYRFDRVPSAEQPESVFDVEDQETWYHVDLTEEPYRVELRSAPDSIAFDLYGSPTGTSLVELALGDRLKKIRVVANSGEILVE